MSVRKSGKDYGSRSGQVMVEAVIALSLLVFAWIIFTFSTYMSTNQIRTAMAARHAAWLKGNGEDPSTEAIASNFFYQAELVNVEVGKGSGIGDLIGGSKVAEMDEFADADEGPYAARVTFGITTADVASVTSFPFTLMRTELPFMPPSLMTEFLQVESTCQWDDVGETWTDWEKALSGVLKTFWNEVKSALGGIAGLL